MNVAKTLAWANNTSLPYDKETSAIIERRVQHVLDGTRTTLARSGLGPRWWPQALKHLCIRCNIAPSDDGESPWSNRFGKCDIKGKQKQFGALLDFMPDHKIKTKTWVRLSSAYGLGFS